MDSSISLKAPDLDLVRYVLGQTPRVPLYEVDMSGVLMGVIERIKHLLKYLPHFKPIAELLDGVFITGCAKRRTDVALVEFPEGISERTKAMEFQTLEEGDATTVSVRKSVLLTESGVILVWSAVYDRPVTVRFTGGRDQVAKESRFEIFDREKLRNAVLYQHHLWRVDWDKVILGILHSLFNEVTECIEQREQYLASMRTARAKMEETLRRIQQPI